MSPLAIFRSASWCCPWHLVLLSHLFLFTGNAGIETRRWSQDQVETAELEQYGGAKTILQHLEYKTLTEVCRCQWQGKSSSVTLFFIHVVLVSIIILHHPFFLILCDSVDLVRK